MKKRVIALLLAGMMCTSALAGCGKIDKSAVIASMEGVDVSMGVANFYCRFQQASSEDVYKLYFGDDVWSQDLYGVGITMEDMLKDSAMDAIHDLYTLKLHMDEYGVVLTEEEKAAIKEAAAAFIRDNSKKACREMGATESIVEEVLTLYTIQNKTRKAIEEKADVNVSDEEANMRGYTRLMIRTDYHTDENGSSVAYTEDEIAALKSTAQDIVNGLAEEGATLESLAAAHSLETTKEAYATYESEAEDDEESGDTENAGDDGDTENTGDSEDAENTEDGEDAEDTEDGEDTENTEDDGNTEDGGDAADSGDGNQEDPVLAALKKLNVGETSGLIETDTALYIVRVDSDTDTEATEKNRASIIDQRKQDYYNEVMDAWQKEDDWYVDPDELAKIRFDQPLTIVNPNAGTQE
ncbi:MAG: peptidyl-prolyl cis-trans isomerase [Agathobacter sp.]|nr:peptidyl-prolyl cis-trans isomerase [Agathobacter sp.]